MSTQAPPPRPPLWYLASPEGVLQLITFTNTYHIRHDSGPAVLEGCATYKQEKVTWQPTPGSVGELWDVEISGPIIFSWAKGDLLEKSSSAVQLRVNSQGDVHDIFGLEGYADAILSQELSASPLESAALRDTLITVKGEIHSRVQEQLLEKWAGLVQGSSEDPNIVLHGAENGCVSARLHSSKDIPVLCDEFNSSLDEAVSSLSHSQQSTPATTSSDGSVSVETPEGTAILPPGAIRATRVESLADAVTTTSGTGWPQKVFTRNFGRVALDLRVGMGFLVLARHHFTLCIAPDDIVRSSHSYVSQERSWFAAAVNRLLARDTEANPLLSPEVDNSIRNAFAAVDSDGSGYISREELMGLFETLGSRLTPEDTMAFDQLLDNSSNSESSGELSASHFRDLVLLTQSSAHAESPLRGRVKSLLSLRQTMEGSLMKKGGAAFARKWQQRHFVLDGDNGLLRWWNTQEACEEGRKANNEISLLNYQEATVVEGGAGGDAGGEAAASFCLIPLSSSSSTPRYDLVASKGSHERQEWVSALCQARRVAAIRNSGGSVAATTGVLMHVVAGVLRASLW